MRKNNLRRKRYKDVMKVGKSSLVPYIETEAWQDRHYRRKEHALQHKEEVRSWCNNNHWKMKIANNGHHWIFITSGSKMIEWFPSTGKLAIGKKWQRGIHCHDYLQLLELFGYAEDKGGT